MITNERQYRIARAEAEKFEEVIAAAQDQEPSPGVHPRIHEAMIDSLGASSLSSPSNSSTTSH